MSLYAHLAWAGICVVLLGLGIAYERHEGAKACVARDLKTATKEQTKVTAEQGAADTEVKEEDADHAKAVAEPVIPVPVVRVCHAAKPSHSGGVLQTTPAASGTAAKADLPAAVEPHPDRRDIGQSVEKVGQAADAQISGLIDYVNTVCLNH